MLNALLRYRKALRIESFFMSLKVTSLIFDFEIEGNSDIGLQLQYESVALDL